MEYICNNLAQTETLANQFAQTLFGGEVITLSGDLGAGKTTFTKFLAKSLGVTEPVTSPTFTLMNQYHSGKFKLFHFDMYRIEDIDEILETGLIEFFGQSDAVCLIEWAENIKQLLPQNIIKIQIEKLGENQRKFVIKR